MRELNTGKIKIMLLNILNSANFALSGEAETGSAGEQPVRNNLTNRNAQEVGNFSTSDILNILIIYALKNSKVTHFCFVGFVRFTLVKYTQEFVMNKNSAIRDKPLRPITQSPVFSSFSNYYF